MFDQIYDRLMQKYGNLDLKELKNELGKDGLGEFVDLLEKDQGLFSKMLRDLPSELGDEMGIMPAVDISGVPLKSTDTFGFEQSACLEKCTGECCKHKNYLMISLADVHNIINSRGGEFFGIRSTRELFEGNPPLLEVFYNEEYQLSFPYIRFSPVGTNDLTTRPEDAKDSVCPFLRPIKTVDDHHKTEVPAKACVGAMGCMLMESKPLICRTSPLGVIRGLETGKVSYEYAPPALECPACESDTEVRAEDHMASIELPGEKSQQQRFHKILMSIHNQPVRKRDRDEFLKVAKDIYNIDGLLARYGCGPDSRPSIDRLTEIYLYAAKGNFSKYEDLINGLKRPTSEASDQLNA